MAKIKDLPKVLRPREKLLRYGPEKLSDSELLAILEFPGIGPTKACESGKILGIGIVDHIIVTKI